MRGLVFAADLSHFWNKQLCFPEALALLRIAAARLEVEMHNVCEANLSVCEAVLVELEPEPAPDGAALPVQIHSNKRTLEATLFISDSH